MSVDSGLEVRVREETAWVSVPSLVRWLTDYATRLEQAEEKPTPAEAVWRLTQSAMVTDLVSVRPPT